MELFYILGAQVHSPAPPHPGRALLLFLQRTGLSLAVATQVHSGEARTLNLSLELRVFGVI